MSPSVRWSVLPALAVLAGADPTGPAGAPSVLGGGHFASTLGGTQFGGGLGSTNFGARPPNFGNGAFGGASIGSASAQPPRAPAFGGALGGSAFAAPLSSAPLGSTGSGVGGVGSLGAPLPGGFGGGSIFGGPGLGATVGPANTATSGFATAPLFNAAAGSSGFNGASNPNDGKAELAAAATFIQQARFAEAKAALATAAQLSGGAREVMAQAGVLRWRMGLRELNQQELDDWLGWRRGLPSAPAAPAFSSALPGLGAAAGAQEPERSAEAVASQDAADAAAALAASQRRTSLLLKVTASVGAFAAVSILVWVACRGAFSPAPAPETEAGAAPQKQRRKLPRQQQAESSGAVVSAVSEAAAGSDASSDFLGGEDVGRATDLTGEGASLDGCSTSSSDVPARKPAAATRKREPQQQKQKQAAAPPKSQPPQPQPEQQPAQLAKVKAGHEAKAALSEGAVAHDADHAGGWCNTTRVEPRPDTSDAAAVAEDGISAAAKEESAQLKPSAEQPAKHESAEEPAPPKLDDEHGISSPGSLHVRWGNVRRAEWVDDEEVEDDEGSRGSRARASDELEEGEEETAREEEESEAMISVLSSPAASQTQEEGEEEVRSPQSESAVPPQPPVGVAESPSELAPPSSPAASKSSQSQEGSSAQEEEEEEEAPSQEKDLSQDEPVQREESEEASASCASESNVGAPSDNNIPLALQGQMVRIGGRTISIYDLCLELGAQSVSSEPPAAETTKSKAEGGAKTRRAKRLQPKSPPAASAPKAKKKVRAKPQPAAAAAVPAAAAAAAHSEKEAAVSPVAVAIPGQGSGLEEEEAEGQACEAAVVGESEAQELVEQFSQDVEESPQDEQDVAIEAAGGLVVAVGGVEAPESDGEDWGWGPEGRGARAPRQEEEREEVPTAEVQPWEGSLSSWENGAPSLVLRPLAATIAPAAAKQQLQPQGQPQQQQQLASPAQQLDLPDAALEEQPQESRADEPRRREPGGTIGSARSASSRPRWADTEDYLDDEEPISLEGSMDDGRPKEPIYFHGGPRRQPQQPSTQDGRTRYPGSGRQQEKENFVQARTTKFRPTGVYVRLRGGEEAFLPVEHMTPFTEAATAAIKERFPQPGRVLVRELSEGMVTMLPESEAKARSQELDARRRRIEEGIAMLRDNYDSRKWMSGKVSSVQPNGAYVTVVEGKDALVPIQEMPESAFGGDDIKLRVGDHVDFRVVRYSWQGDSFLASMLSYDESRAARGLREDGGARSVPPAARSTSAGAGGARRSGKGGSRGGRSSAAGRMEGGPDRLRSSSPSVAKPPSRTTSRLSAQGFSVVDQGTAEDLNEWLRLNTEEKKARRASSKGGPKSADRKYIVNAVRGMNSKVIGQMTIPARASDKEIKEAAADLALKNGELKAGQDHKGIVISKNIVNVKL